MAAAAEAAERVDCDLGLLRRDADDVEAAVAQQQFEIRPAGLALAAFDDKGQLDPRHCRYQPNRCLAKRVCETLSIGFAEQDRNERRGVDDH